MNFQCITADEFVVKANMRLPKQPHEVTARERVRLAIRRRLDDLGMTGRAFGRSFSANHGKGHVDTWVSGLLNGQFALSLDELDEAARILETKASELVRSPHDHSDYLSPAEYELLTTVRSLPPVMREVLVTLAQYLVGVTPAEIEFLDEYRDLTDDEQGRVRHWTRALRIARAPTPDLAILPGPAGTSVPPDVAKTRRHRGRQKNE